MKCLLNKTIDVQINKKWTRIKTKIIIPINENSVKIITVDGQWIIRPNGTWKVVGL